LEAFALSVTVSETPSPSIATAKTEAKISLVVLGSVCAALFVVGILLSFLVGGKEKVVGHPATTQVVTTDGQTQTTTVLADQTTTKKGLPSDGLLEALLATGAMLIVIGLLYGRITVIKFPGGGELDLSADEVKKTAATALAAANQTNAPSETVSGITATALAHAREKKRATGSLTDKDIDAAVREAAAGYLQIVVHDGTE
jgi:hypothetical protein